MCNEFRVKQAFKDAKSKSYACFFNSSNNGRGVGILVSNNLQFNVLQEHKDLEENFLALKINISGKCMIICSIYGPNKTDKPFFNRLAIALRRNGSGSGDPTIMGGDWNCNEKQYK